MPSRELTGSLISVVLFAAAVLVVWSFLSALVTPLLVFLLGVLLAVVLYPIKRFLSERWKLPGIVAVAIPVIGSLVVFVGAFVLIVPIVAEQLRNLQDLARTLQTNPGQTDLVEHWPQLRRVIGTDEAQLVLKRLVGAQAALAGDLLGIISRVLEGLSFAFFTMLVLVFTLAGMEVLTHSVLMAFPEDRRDRAVRAARRIGHGVAMWGLVNVGLATMTGVLTFLGFMLIGLENALLFGAFQGLGEFIPNVGPLAAGAIVALAATVTSPDKVGLVVLISVGVQVLQSFVTPLFLGRTVDLHPVSIVLGVLLLGTKFGLLGALIAVPVLLIVKVLYEEFYLSDRQPLHDVQLRDALRADQ